MDLRFEPLDLRLRRTFRIAHGAYDERGNVLVRLRHGGQEGLGEAAVVPYRGQVRAETCDFLARLAPLLKDHDPFRFQALDALLQGADPRGCHPGGRAAVECACLDLVGRFLGLPLWRLLGLDPAAAPPTSFTLPVAGPEESAALAREAADLPILKVKIRALEGLESVRAVRQARPDALLRVDANASLDAARALEAASELGRVGGVDLFEQPVAASDLEGLARVAAASPVPIFADESVQAAADIPRLAGRVQGVNLKLAKVGGLRPALAAIATARSCGLKVMLGCMLESSLAVTACAHLAPLADHADLDGPLLLAADPFQGVGLAGGALVLPEDPGLGVSRRA